MAAADRPLLCAGLGTRNARHPRQRGQVASGRANGQLSLAWGETTRLEGSLRFFNADFQGLAPRSNSLRTVAIGKVTGRFDFAAPEFRTLDDLTGVLEAKLAQSQALDLPVLNLLVPFVVPGQSATTFQSGDIRARLGRGTLRIQRLALLSPAVKVVVEGNVGLNGRLDLEATAQTGNLGLNYVALRVIAQSVPTIGPVPVALIARASALLANQVVHLRISGTVKSPSARRARVAPHRGGRAPAGHSVPLASAIAIAALALKPFLSSFSHFTVATEPWRSSLPALRDFLSYSLISLSQMDR